MLVEGHPEWSDPDRARTDVRPQVRLKMCIHSRTTPLWHRYTQNGIPVSRKTTRRRADGHDPIVISPADQTGVAAPERAPYPKSSVLQTEKVNSKQPDHTPRSRALPVISRLRVATAVGDHIALPVDGHGIDVSGGSASRTASVCDPPYMGDVLPMLERPVYTYREVDRLLGLNQDTAKRWINDYRRGGHSYAPIVREQPLHTRWVTWGEFIETRLLSEYRDLDQIKIGKMRAVIAQLRERYDRRYPLAYSRPFVRARDREIIARAQDESGLEDEFWFVVRADQYLMTPRTQRFFDAITYGPDPDIASDDALVTATRIDPRYPDVVLDPRTSQRPTHRRGSQHLDSHPRGHGPRWRPRREDRRVVRADRGPGAAGSRLHCRAQPGRMTRGRAGEGSVRH